MPQFAANLSTMFIERPFLERFSAAAETGFTAVEYLFPYEHSVEALAAALHEADLEQVLFNAPAGDWKAGERGIAALEGRDREFEQGLQIALSYAEALSCRQLHVMAGVATRAESSDQIYIRRIREAAEAAAGHDVRILLEPVNPIDMPGYFLNSVTAGLELLERIDHPNTGLQLDVYHAQIIEGDITRLIRKAAPVTSHIQIASVPERHEPDVGELNYPWLFALLDTEGYTGRIGCEYHPCGPTEDGLAWFAPYRETQERVA